MYTLGVRRDFIARHFLIGGDWGLENFPNSHHYVLELQLEGSQLDQLTLNGLGYLGLLGAYLLPIAFFQQRHNLVWWVLVGYTALTIILWIVMGDKTFVAGTDSAIGYYAKAAEVLLLVFLWADKPKS